MSDAVKQAKQYINNKNYDEALKLARNRHGKDDIEDYITILDLLIDENYIIALEEKGMYYQYWDETHDNGDYGEKYFDQYLEIQPRSINVISDKALSRFNKGYTEEALNYMDKAYEKYNSYSKIEKPRIRKKEVLMAKIELQIQSKRYNEALSNLNNYEDKYGMDEKLQLYKGQMLQKAGKNRQAIDYLDKSLESEDTLVGFNAKADALYELKEYKDALKIYKRCIEYERRAQPDLELATNFNYKAAFCCVKLGNNQEAITHLNKTIEMLNKHGRLPNDIESIYQKCSFEKERIMKTGKVKDKEFKKGYFLSTKTAIYVLILILILYIILRAFGYN